MKLLEDYPMNTLGKRLKFARKEKGLTQAELQKLSGVSQQMISLIESEKVESTTEVFNLSEALEVNPKWLATGNGEIKNQATELTRDEEVILKLFRQMSSNQKNETLRTFENTEQENALIIKEHLERTMKKRAA
jgi:transcriptional regulator with XRE-family HTH domain